MYQGLRIAQFYGLLAAGSLEFSGLCGNSFHPNCLQTNRWRDPGGSRFQPPGKKRRGFAGLAVVLAV